MKGWARRWRDNGWLRTPTKKARNHDLWAQLLDACSLHQVTFKWVQGHAGNRENERCDRLSVEAATGAQLPIDSGYEEAQAQVSGERQGHIEDKLTLFADETPN